MSVAGELAEIETVLAADIERAKLQRDTGQREPVCSGPPTTSALPALGLNNSGRPECPDLERLCPLL